MSYKIIRYREYGNGEVIETNEVIATGLTLEEAQEHCYRDDSHGDGWFDGYTEEEEN